MDASDVKRNLSSRLAPEFAKELVDTYVECRKRYRREDWKSCLNEAGQFCEAAAAAVYQLATVTSQTPSGEVLDLNQIHFDDVIKKLPKISNKTPEQESTVLLMPRIARALYCLRSKKRANHLKKTKLNFFDATFAVQACTWLLSELIRISHTDDEQTIRACMQTLFKREYPFVDLIDGDLVVLARKFSTLNQILLLLLLAPRNKMAETKVIESLRYLKYKYVKQKICDGDLQGLLYRKKGIVYLTSTGMARIEDKIDRLSRL